MTRWVTGARYQICLVQMLAPLARPHPALTRHLPPRRGRLLRRNDFSMFYLLTCHQIGAVSISYGTTVAAFPFEGEGGAKRRMRAGGRRYFYSLWKGFFGLCVASRNTSQQRRSRLLAPRLGRGSLCGNGWWSRLIFGGLCRFAQDDTWGGRGVVRNLFGANVSTVRPPSSGADAPPSPSKGKALSVVRGFM